MVKGVKVTECEATEIIYNARERWYRVRYEWLANTPIETPICAYLDHVSGAGRLQSNGSVVATRRAYRVEVQEAVVAVTKTLAAETYKSAVDAGKVLGYELCANGDKIVRLKYARRDWKSKITQRIGG